MDRDEFSMDDLAQLPADARRWVLDCREPARSREDDALGRYLRWGMKQHQAHAGYLASRREPWYALERRGDSPILFTYMNRDRPRFIRNRARAVPLNTFLIVEPYEGAEDELWRSLNSRHVHRQLTQERRNYGGGLWKLEPAELGEIRVKL